MKLKLATLALAIASSNAAFAGTIILDDFSADQAKAFDPAVGGVGNVSPTVGPSTYWTSRDLTIARTGGNENANIVVSAGTLKVNNDTDVSSVGTVQWFFNSTLTSLIAGATYFELTIDAIKVDVGQVTVGSAVRTSAQGPGTVVVYSAASLSNPFSLLFTSALDADSQWDNVQLSYSCRAGATSITGEDRQQEGACPSQVPVPGSLALLGLGLLGFAGIRRKV